MLYRRKSNDKGAAKLSNESTGRKSEDLFECPYQKAPKRYTAISVLKRVVIVVLIEGNRADVSQPFSFEIDVRLF